MKRLSHSVAGLSAMILALACSSNPPAQGPSPETAQAPSAQPAAQPDAPAGALTDERAMELGRRFAQMFLAGEHDKLWESLAPSARERFGSVEEFRSRGQEALKNLGAELGVVSEQVEPARTGMMADKLYLRVSRYAGSQEGPVRLMIGVKSDGTLVGMQIRRAE